MDDLDALLADLQNSVPGQTTTAHHHHHSNVNYGSSVPGYGSLSGPRSKQSPQSPTYQAQAQRVTETRTSPIFNGSSPTGYQSMPRNVGSSSTGASTSFGSLPRSQTTTTTTTVQKQQQQPNAGNMSELDSLLQDLSTARYGQNIERRSDNGVSSPSGRSFNDSTMRPSVDSLLDELSNANATGPIYAVPNGSSTPEPGHVQSPGRHVTITVRETKTERITGSPSPSSPNYVPALQSQSNQVHETITKSQQQQNASPGLHASTATKELDDLMASLSDFKINSSSHQHQTVTDYAKPTKGISYIHQEEETTVTTTRTPQVPYQPRDQLDSMLGNLQADMSRQGVTTTQKGCCNACDKPIVGQVITALGKTWHPEHFTCNHCNQELGTRNFFERDGYPYCEPDYHNLFSPRCAYCNGAILDKCVTALEKTWHTEHFFCAQCGQQFGEEGFHERDGKPYCRNDYFDMFAPKCSGCNRAIMENYISALNAQWHPACFVCRDCKKPVSGKSFYAMEGKPVCPPCVGVDEEE